MLFDLFLERGLFVGTARETSDTDGISVEVITGRISVSIFVGMFAACTGRLFCETSLNVLFETTCEGGFSARYSTPVVASRNAARKKASDDNEIDLTSAPMRACRAGLIGAEKSSSSALPLFDAKENRSVWLMRLADPELPDQNLIVTSREDKSVRRLVGVILITIESAIMQVSFPKAASVLSAYDNERNRRLEGIEFFGITDLQVH